MATAGSYRCGRAGAGPRVPNSIGVVRWVYAVAYVRPDGLEAYLKDLRTEGWKVLSIERPPGGRRHGVRARRTVTV